MKTRNFKVRFHNIDLPSTTFLVEAKDHAEVFRRFSGIIRNRGYAESRAYWRGYHAQLKNFLRLYVPTGKRKTRTYFFLPKDALNRYRMTSEVRRKLEVAIEVTRLK